jgi:hypothetical protein
MSEKGKNEKGGKKKKKSRGKLFLFTILALGVAPFGMPTLLVAMGLVPTFVAFLTDSDDHRSATATVGFLNVAGVLPFLIDLWSKGQTMEAALAIVREPSNWLIMLGSAAVGQLLYFALPPAVALMSVAQLETRKAKLKQAQEELKAVWGPDVANVIGLDEVRKKSGG